MNKQELLDIVYCSHDMGINNQKIITLTTWVKCLIQGRSPFDQLMQGGIDKIIVYGINDLGEMLVKEALKEGYKISGITDRRVSGGQYDFCGIPVFTNDELGNHKEEYIVVTAVTFWDEIKSDLNRWGCCNVIALWELM